MPERPGSGLNLRLIGALTVLVIAAVAVVALARGGDEPAVAGTTVAGREIAPPWSADYAGLARRARTRGIPEPGKETFHQHALIRIYQDGLLVPMAEFMGLDRKRKVYAGLHTHDASGVLHLEADKPFTATLGDVFAMWNVAFGPDRMGALRNGDGRELRVYVNGERIGDPAAHVIRKDDVIVIAFDDGEQELDLTPDTTALDKANKGGSMACSLGDKGEKKTSCIIEE